MFEVPSNTSTKGPPPPWTLFCLNSTNYAHICSVAYCVLLIIHVYTYAYLYILSVNPNSIGGLFGSCDAKFSEKCPFSPNNDTALIKQISLFDAALAMKNT